MRHILYMMYIGVAVVLHTACSQVELNEEMTGNPYGGFAFQYDWNGKQGGDMYVVLNRIIDTRHYVALVDANGKPLAETEESRAGQDAEEGNGDDTENPTEETPTPEEGTFLDNRYQVRPGSYIAVTVSKPESEGVYSIPDIDKFGDDTSISLNNLAVEVKELAETDIPELQDDFESGDERVRWIDRNSGYPFINKLVSPIYYSRVDNVDIKSASPATIGFRPTPITQTLHIPFTLNVEEGVTVTKIVAEISGVARKVVMSSGAIDTENTYRVIFTPTPSGQNSDKYDATINVLGIVSSTSASLTAGPGIFQLAIYAEADGKKRTFVATKNLYSSIQKAQPLLYNEKTGTYSIAKTDVVLDAGGYAFMIRKADVSTENTGGADEWDKSNDEIKGEL